MSNLIGPTVKQLWNYAVNVLHNFLALTQTQQLFAWADPAFISCSMVILNFGMDEESHLLLLVHFWLQDFDLERSPRDFWRPPDFPSTDSLTEIPRIWGAMNPTKTSSWSSSSLFGLARPAPWRVFRPAIQRDCSRSNAKNSCKLFLPSVGINQIRLQNGT